MTTVTATKRRRQQRKMATMMALTTTTTTTTIASTTTTACVQRQRRSLQRERKRTTTNDQRQRQNVCRLAKVATVATVATVAWGAFLLRVLLSIVPFALRDALLCRLFQSAIDFRLLFRRVVAVVDGHRVNACRVAGLQPRHDMTWHDAVKQRLQR